jgi:hypothetical protein
MTFTIDALINEGAQASGYSRNRSVELAETFFELIKFTLVSGGMF